jgi:hypothetical protein
LNPSHKTVKEQIEVIELYKKNLIIRNITIINRVKTSQKRILKNFHLLKLINTTFKPQKR